METQNNKELIAFLEVDLKYCTMAELATGMNLYFIKVTPIQGVHRIYFKFFNDLDAAVDFFYVKHKLNNLRVSSLSTAVAKFQWNLHTVNIYDINSVLSKFALENLEDPERDPEKEVKI